MSFPKIASRREAEESASCGKCSLLKSSKPLQTKRVFNAHLGSEQQQQSLCSTLGPCLPLQRCQEVPWLKNHLSRKELQQRHWYSSNLGGFWMPHEKRGVMRKHCLMHKVILVDLLTWWSSFSWQTGCIKAVWGCGQCCNVLRCCRDQSSSVCSQISPGWDCHCQSVLNAFPRRLPTWEKAFSSTPVCVCSFPLPVLRSPGSQDLFSHVF